MNHFRLAQKGRRLRDGLVVLGSLLGWFGIGTDAHGQGFLFDNPPGYTPAPGVRAGYGGSFAGPAYRTAPGYSSEFDPSYGISGYGTTTTPSPWTGFNTFSAERGMISSPTATATAASPWGPIAGVLSNPPALTSGPLTYANTYRDNKVILPGGYYAFSNGQWYFVKTNTAPPYKWSRGEFNDRVAPPTFPPARSQLFSTSSEGLSSATRPVNRSASPTAPPRGVIPPTPPVTTTTISVAPPVTRPTSASTPTPDPTAANARRPTLPPLPAVSPPAPARPASAPVLSIR